MLNKTYIANIAGPSYFLSSWQITLFGVKVMLPNKEYPSLSNILLRPNTTVIKLNLNYYYDNYITMKKNLHSFNIDAISSSVQFLCTQIP